MHAFEQVTLTTQRLLLRPLRADDAAALFAIFSDARIMQYWSTPAWTEIATADETIARRQRGMAAGESLSFAIVRAEDQKLLGDCDLFHLDAQCRRAEVGYGLAYEAWGHGYMHEALLALIGYGFDELDLNRVEADIDPGNSASAKSLTRLGFTQEGLLRERWIVGGEKSDSAMYGLLASEWQARSQPA